MRTTDRSSPAQRLAARRTGRILQQPVHPFGLIAASQRRTVSSLLPTADAIATPANPSPANRTIRVRQTTFIEPVAVPDQPKSRRSRSTSPIEIAQSISSSADSQFRAEYHCESSVSDRTLAHV